MGLKCSVIGHKYGEAEVEREREEQGSEVVITIQERETCKRCGKTRIVSENKEVTAIETPSDIAGDMIDDAEPEGDETADADDASVEDDSSADTTAEDETTPAADEQQPAVSGESDAPEDSTVDAVDPDADDAEILDDGDDESVAGGDSELENPSTEVSVAEAEELDAEESAVASDPEEDDGMIIDGDDEDESAVDDREPGEWPDEPDDDGDDWTPETVATEADEDDEESSEVEPFGGAGVTVPNGQFSCPECDFTTDVASSSLRAGDFCPECHKGALVNTAE
ncbi:DUF7093 family protein [Haloarcula salinisoli]|uniref:Uncharacterized protein n=1 Tax=Haloarcula salinisoli TaxID=2487746 RepID=A0A8J7YAZ6_9EURY|nr:hypothetical protein [Halomicroarcula salinisoli]MBX0302122.1 hypothetical protein [Halomicroarcula salinisoli]